MLDDTVTLHNLGAFSEKEKELVRTNFEYKKKMSNLLKEARQAAKKDTCYFCGKSVTSFCNSHSVPKFCLENIDTNGEVLTLNTIVDNPFMDTKSGVNKAGTFYLICNDCDSKIFSDYENPDNYSNQPTPKMIAQIALKNNLKQISKRLFEIEFYNILAKKKNMEWKLSDINIRNAINEIDLKEYDDSYKKAKKALEKNTTTDYYVCYYEKLNYVVPIAFQSSLALAFDLEGSIINNLYSSSAYKIQNIHINILPLKSETAIIMFIEDGDKRYRQFYHQFKKLTLEDKLATLTLIIFMYSEDMYFSKSIEKEVRENKKLCEIGKTGIDIYSSTPFFHPLKILRKSHSLDKRHEIPNLLSEKYKLQ